MKSRKEKPPGAQVQDIRPGAETQNHGKFTNSKKMIIEIPQADMFPIWETH